MSADAGSPSDPLLSVDAVARLWGTGLTAVLQSIESGQLRTLDRGLLVGEGRFDVPLIRSSWVESVQRESPGFSRIVRPEAGVSIHPAFDAALAFHSALDLGDAQGVFEWSSEASRQGRSPEQLLAAWAAVADHLHEGNAGIGTAIYSLAPLEAVAARVMEHTPAMPRAITAPTPATMLAALPLVEEESGWRVDLPLFERRDEWIQLLASPLPEAGDEPAASSDSPSSDS